MRRLVAALCLAFVAACSPSGTVGPASSPAETNAKPMPTLTPMPAPVQPGSASSQVIFVQQAEDASLVSGGDPIRLTLARTQNETEWFTDPPQRRAGTMSTAEAMLSLGWRPSNDGRTSPMAQPGPSGLLAGPWGEVAFTVLSANVRPDGTLVLDISPLGAEPETNSSLGPVSVTLDGVAGAVVVERDVAPGIVAQVVVTGQRNQQAVVRLMGTDAQTQEGAYVAIDRPSAQIVGDVIGDGATLSDIDIALMAPSEQQLGSVTLTGRLTTIDGESMLTQVIARWSLPG